MVPNDAITKELVAGAHFQSGTPIKLIVLDSIAASVRADFDENEFSERGRMLQTIAQILKRLAGEHEIAVVVTNHVVDKVEAADLDLKSRSIGGVRQGNLALLMSSGRAVLPALGLGWSNCVNTRLVVSRLRSPSPLANPAESDGTLVVRRLHVQLSQHLPFRECYYVVELGGIRGVHLGVGKHALNPETQARERDTPACANKSLESCPA